MFKDMNVAELRAECKARGLSGYSKARKVELVSMLNANQAMADKARTEAPMVLPKPTMAEPIHPVAASPFGPSRSGRNRAKARRRAIRATGGQAGC